MKIGLIPLDERPANTRYPQMIGQIAGVDVILPPAQMLSAYRSAANFEQLTNWLWQTVEHLDALVVSIEMFAYGGLISSRISDEPVATLINRLDVLRRVKQAYPDLPIYGFNVITRISKSSESLEEPDYWNVAGAQLYRYSQAYDQSVRENTTLPTFDNIKDSYLLDFVRRRQRNHMVNLGVLDLLADSVFDLLVMSSDDTSKYGFGSREKAWLAEWVDRRGGDDRLLMYPGADEVGTVLVVRAILQAQQTVPRFYVTYAIEADQHRIAPFEDVPVSQTIERQIVAVGGVRVDEIADADVIVAVNPPAPSGRDFFDPVDAKTDRAYRQDAVETFVKKIKTWMNDGQQVIVCDVAYPNGSDPVLVEALQSSVDLKTLASYGAWNTAGNTIGVALGQGIANYLIQDEIAQRRFLIHRFVEDYGYMHHVRQDVADDMVDARLDDETLDEIVDKITIGLNNQLIGLFDGWRVVNVRLPWRRLFEVDFDLERV